MFSFWLAALLKCCVQRQSQNGGRAKRGGKKRRQQPPLAFPSAAAPSLVCLCVSFPVRPPLSPPPLAPPLDRNLSRQTAGTSGRENAGGRAELSGFTSLFVEPLASRLVMLDMRVSSRGATD